MNEQPQLEPIPTILDVETTLKCPVGNHKANPFWPENKIVLGGTASLSPGSAATGDVMTYNGHAPGFYIGHNIGFDLHYLMKHNPKLIDSLATDQLWDTQLAEYLLSGQQVKFASLDECAAKRGGTLKDDRVSVMFKAGKGADEVPRNMLEDYLKADLENTRKVFISQYAEAEEKGMLPLLWSQMDARLATIDMIWNGLKVDRDFLKSKINELSLQQAGLHGYLHGTATRMTGVSELDPTKPNDLATILFGGVYKWKEREKVGVYKNGKDKLKWVEKEKPVTRWCNPDEAWLGKNGRYSTDDSVLQYIADLNPLHSELGKFVRQVQDYRDITKQLSTYFEGIDALVMPDGMVHHNLNHCVTATGRLSSSEPNLQNVTDGKKGDIKKAFISRWGEDGFIVEADYSQLEMVMLAVLSEDEQLLSDIRSGVDMHKALFKAMYGRDMTPDERKKFKRCSFALVYGAGATGISTQGGISKADAKKFIKTFYDRYPGVKAWHDRMIEMVDALRCNYGDKDTATGLPIGKSEYISPFSQRRYVFREYPLSPEIKAWKKKDVGFSPTEIKNYPVQGGATGDIVPLVLGKLFRVLRNNPRLAKKCLLINTVHDSIMFDCHKDVLAEAIPLIRSVMENAPAYIKETFGFEFQLDLKVGISYGPDWFNQTEVENDTLLQAA